MATEKVYQCYPGFTNWKISIRHAGITPMKNRRIKIAIFAYYTWFIFNLYFIVTGPLFIYIYGYEMWSNYVIELFFFWVLIEALTTPPYWALITIPVLCAFFSIFNILQLAIWWQKPNLVKAWMVSMSGILTEIGTITFFGGMGKRGVIHLAYMLIAMTFFYLSLYLADRLQRKYLPNNRLASKIRWLLRWPCMNLPEHAQAAPEDSK